MLERYKTGKKVLSINPDSEICTEIKAQAYSEHFKNLLAKHDMPHIRLYDLRHFNAVIMMKYNVPDKVAAQRLGHSNTQTLREVYQHVLVDMDEAVASKIDGLFRKG